MLSLYIFVLVFFLFLLSQIPPLMFIENPTDKPEAPPCIPKGVLKCSGHNPNARSAKNYLVVEDLGQTPCVMSALECFRIFLYKGKPCCLLLGLLTIALLPLSNLKPWDYNLACLTTCLYSFM